MFPWPCVYSRMVRHDKCYAVLMLKQETPAGMTRTRVCVCVYVRRERKRGDHQRDREARERHRRAGCCLQESAVCQRIAKDTFWQDSSLFFGQSGQRQTLQGKMQPSRKDLVLGTVPTVRSIIWGNNSIIDFSDGGICSVVF